MIRNEAELLLMVDTTGWNVHLIQAVRYYDREEEEMK